MSEIAETVSEAVEKGQGDGNGREGHDRMNSIIALMVAVIATFMALCNVKDGNIVQAMAQDQASAVDEWSLYQAKGTKLNLAESVMDQLTLERELRPELSADARGKLDKKIAEYVARVKLYETEKAEIMAKAKGFQEDYDALNVHDDQFDLAEALMSVAIALLGITALTRHRTLLWFGVGLGGLGVVFGFAGFLKLGLHPDFLTRLFS
ncbi:MAG TPA: DUF4337 domain-containing protein [Polyangia bacterium]|nr:DUF4337 domain-containing protein [Polyangia bacterium]